MGISIPRLKGMRDEANVTKAKREVKVLQAAVESYRMNHANTLPTTITTDLTGAFPQMISADLPDPFNTTAPTYQYDKSTDGKYYVIFSVGLNGTAETIAPADATGYVSPGGDDIVTGNGLLTVAGSLATTASCVANIDCATGVCGGAISPVCLATGNVPIDGDCTLDSECQSGYCGIDVATGNPVCTNGELGSFCNYNNQDCASGRCGMDDNSLNAYCVDGEPGSFCGGSGGAICKSGYCDLDMNVASSVCTDGEVGSPCNFGGNGSCKSGSCAPDEGSGAFCL